MARVTPPPDGIDPPASAPDPVGPVLPAVSPTLAGMLARGAASAESVVPGVTSGRDFTPYPAVDPADPFMLWFDVNRWTVIQGQIVPQLGKLVYVPGVNAVDRGEDGLPDTTLAIAHIEASGRKPIPFEVDGPGTSYLVRIKVGTARKKKTDEIVPVYSYHCKWETLWPGSSEVGVDEIGYARWLRALVERGFLPEPRPYVLERLRSALITRLGHYRNKGTGRHPLVDRYESDLRAVEAHMLKLGLGPPAAAEPVAALS